MPQAAECRKRAEECVEIARTARTPSQRTMLLHIADTWQRLAREAEENLLPPVNGNGKGKSRRTRH